MQATIENYLPRRLNDEQSFVERAAVCSSLLISKPELIQAPGGVVNQPPLRPPSKKTRIARALIVPWWLPAAASNSSVRCSISS